MYYGEIVLQVMSYVNFFYEQLIKIKFRNVLCNWLSMQ